MFLLVPAYPGCPGSKAVKRSSLLLLLTAYCHLWVMGYGWRDGLGLVFWVSADAVIHPSVRLSVPPDLGGPARSAAPRPAAPQLPCRPPELCGLRIRPRTDVDPPRSAGVYRLAAR